MLIAAALILGGSIVYLTNDDAGALMIAFGCGLALVQWLHRVLPGGDRKARPDGR